MGDEGTTAQVKVKHLICACTGLPRQDYEWLFEFDGVTTQDALGTLATMQPTSGFGEMYQYSNPLAGAGGVGRRDDRVPQNSNSALRTTRPWQRLVFEPLRMKSTTFDFEAALRRNHAMPHAPNMDNTPEVAAMDVNYAVIPVRPAGGAWSNVRDVLAYVMMELSEGLDARGNRYLSKDVLLARRTAQVAGW